MKSYIWKKYILGNRKNRLTNISLEKKKNRPLRILEVIKVMFHFSPLFYISIYCPIAFQKKKSTISYQHGNMKYFTKQLMSLFVLQNKITNESIVKIKDLFSLTFLRHHHFLLLLNQKTCIFSDF